MTTKTKCKCTATTAKHLPCRAWAVPGSSPPRCAAHGGTSKPPGAPVGNRNAETHGLYGITPTPPLTIAAIIRDLAGKQKALSDYIQAQLKSTDADLAALTELFALHAQTASRLGRLLRDQRALSGQAADGLAGAIGQALDELSNELGVEL